MICAFSLSPADQGRSGEPGKDLGLPGAGTVRPLSAVPFLFITGDEIVPHMTRQQQQFRQGERPYLAFFLGKPYVDKGERSGVSGDVWHGGHLMPCQHLWQVTMETAL